VAASSPARLMRQVLSVPSGVAMTARSIWGPGRSSMSL
jgi:hypothetical protein